MLKTEQRLRDAATALRMELASVAVPAPPQHGSRRGFVGVLALAMLVIVAGVGAWLYTSGGDARPAAAVQEPDRPADIVVLYPSESGEVSPGMVVSDLDRVVDELAGLTGVSVTSGWDAARQLFEFKARYAEQPAATAGLTRADLPSSVNLWLAAGTDPRMVAEQVRERLPEALHIIVGEEYVLADFPWWEGGVTTSHYQLMVLGDNQVTRAEYEASVAAVVDCVRAEGIWVSNPIYEDGQLGFIMGGTESTEEMDAIDLVYDRCYAQFQDTVDAAWMLDNYSEEEAQETRDEIGTCLRFRGFEISEHPTHQEVITVIFEEAWNESEEVRNSALECMRSY
jgi:hypothetical protein